MTLTAPFWLILAIPLVMSLWLWRMPSRLLQAMRWLVVTLLVLAMCGLSVMLPLRSGVVVLVADRSLSMPAESPALQKEAADIVHAAMGAGDRLAVVSFAETAALEQAPQAGKFTGFAADVGREASQLADALDLALSLTTRDQPARLLVLSDGRWTGRNISASVAQAAALGVPIDYRPMQRQTAGDLAIARLEGPASAMPGESFVLAAWIHSPLAQTISYELQRGAQMIARGTQQVPSGTSRLLFRDTATERGSHEYVLRVHGSAPDPIPENNRARLLVGIRGARPLLCVRNAGATGLPALLRKGGLNVDAKTPGQCVWTLEELATYSGVILENTTANSVGLVGMQNLAAWVSQSGGGLMMTGGRDSYGPGGYYKSPLEPILPVSMELRREHRKLSLAIVVALDRSGSMNVPVRGGRVKMDLANLATAEVVNMLSPQDEFGCLAVDSAAHEIVPLTEVANPDAIRSKVLRIDSRGGGIFIYEALSAAAAMIATAKANTKHIILFADAADSEHPETYKELLEKCRNAGITVTVIGLGTENDSDAELLKDVGRRGGGQCMFTDVAEELPRLFAQDTFVIARNAFLDDPVAVRATGGLTALTQQTLGAFPQIGGYNLCYARPRANVALLTEDEYHAPVLASWQAGLGRVLCYTGEADGEYTGAIAKWKHAGDFFTSLGRWTAGATQGLGPGVMATERLENGVCRVELHLDPEREAAPFTTLPELTTLSAEPGGAAVATKTKMHWESADTLIAELPLAGSNTLLTTVEVPGLGHTTLAPLCLPYSPEYAPEKPGRGIDALEQTAKATGGCERLILGDIWQAIPRKPRWFSLTPYLLTAAVVLLLLEVVQRRTGLLAFGGPAFGLWREKVARKVRQRKPAAARKSQPKAAPEKRGIPEPKPTPAAASTATQKMPAADDAMANAFSQAQQRARKRTNRS